MAEEHVRGRMLLEENPGNRNPALPPQFDTTGKGDYRKVTPENPLPTANYVMSESGLWIPEPEVRGTQLTGSNVEEIPTKIKGSHWEVKDWDKDNASDLEVRDTETHQVWIPHMHLNESVYEQSIFILNTLDADLELDIQLGVEFSGTGSRASIIWSTSTEGSIKPNWRITLMPEVGETQVDGVGFKRYAIPELRQPARGFYFRFKAKTAPTKGGIAITQYKRY